MKANRILTVLIVLACVLSTVVALRPGWLNCQWSRECSGPTQRTILPADGLTVARVRRLELKGAAIQRLRTGELTLFETAAVFGQLNALPPVLENREMPQVSGSDEGERLCRQVIFWARAEWKEDLRPEELKAHVERLERELEAHLAAHGEVQLPTLAL